MYLSLAASLATAQTPSASTTTPTATDTSSLSQALDTEETNQKMTETPKTGEEIKPKTKEAPPLRPPIWNIWLSYGMGIKPLNDVARPAHVELGFGRPLAGPFEYAFYLAQSSAQVRDDIYFQNTGNTENRLYEITSQGTGLRLQAKITNRTSVYSQFGITRTTSKLTQVTTDAPIPPALSPGKQEGEVWSTAYRIGASYEYFLKNLSAGASLSYGSSSSNKNAEIRDIALGAHLRFTWREAEKPKIKPKDAETQTEENHSKPEPLSPQE